MSSSIAIPRSKLPQSSSSKTNNKHKSPSSYDSLSDSSSSSPSSARSLPFAPSRPSPLATVESTMEGSSSASPSSKAKDKARAREDSIGGGKESPLMPRRTSLMGAELEKVDHIVVEVGSPEAPRWVSFTFGSIALSGSNRDRFRVLGLHKDLTGTSPSFYRLTWQEKMIWRLDKILLRE